MTPHAKVEHLTAQGYETIYAGNFLGHFLLLRLLLPALKPGSRVSVTSSIAHWLHSADLDELLPSGKLARTSLKGANFYPPLL